MRLTEDESRIIRDTVRRRFGRNARVWLFGSRTDDTRRGGDIAAEYTGVDKGASDWHIVDQVWLILFPRVYVMR